MTGERLDQSATYFDSTNKQAQRDREKLASQCLENLITWLKEGGNVGIHGTTLLFGIVSFPTLTLLSLPIISR